MKPGEDELAGRRRLLERLGEVMAALNRARAIENQIFLLRPTVIIWPNLSIFGMLPNSSMMK